MTRSRSTHADRARAPSRGTAISDTARGLSDPRALHLESPVPNPPPLPTDLPAPRLVTPRGALRVSLVFWGLGHVAAGDKRGWLGPLVQLASLASLAAFATAAGQGTNAILVFLAGAAVLATWLVIAADAHRVAMRRHAALDVTPRALGGLELLWLAPLLVAGSTLLWANAGRLADPGTVVGDYVNDWRAGRADAALPRFAAPPGDAAALALAWDRQLSGLRNDLVRVAAVAGPTSRIDPDHPFDSVRWLAQGTGDERTAVFDVAVVRTQSVRGQLLGLLPSTAQRVETVERLGRVELRLEDLAGPLAGRGWRIVRIEIGGVSLHEP